MNRATPGRRVRKLYCWVDENSPTLMGLVILIAFGSGALYSVYLGDGIRFPDEREYFSLASNVVNNGVYSYDGVEPSTFRPPGYPLFLALMMLISERVEVLRMFNFLALSLSCYFVYRICRHLCNSVAGIIGACLTIAYPVLFYTAGTLYPQTVATTLLLGILLLTIRTKITVLNSIALGLLIGVLVLTIPTFVVACACVVGWCVFVRRSISPRHLVLLAAVFFLVVGSWTVRNYRATDHFVAISSNSGLTFLLGNSEHTEPNSGVTIDISAYLEDAPRVDELARDAYFRNQALDYIASHKLDSARMYGLKILNYFNYRNDLSTGSESSPARDLLMLVTYGGLMLLTIARLGVARFLPLASFEKLLIAIYIMNAFTDAVFVTRIRYRLPFDLLLIILGAVLLGILVKRHMEDVSGERVAVPGGCSGWVRTRID